MKWESTRGDQRLCTFDLTTNVKAVPVVGATVIGNSINQASILTLAADITEAIQDVGTDEHEFNLCFSKYGLVTLHMDLSTHNWSAADWEFFVYDVAMALVAAVRAYRLKTFKRGMTETQIQMLTDMETYILKQSGDANAHIKIHKDEYLEKVAETSSYSTVQAAGSDFMNLPV